MNKPRHYSLTLRLALIFALLAFALLATLGVALYRELERELVMRDDAALIYRIDQLRNLLNDSNTLDLIKTKPELFQNMLGNRESVLSITAPGQKPLLTVNPGNIDLPAVPEIPYDKLDPHSQWLYLAHGQDRHSVTPDHVRKARHAYYAMASYVDEKIGRVLEALEKSGLADDAIVVFCADHGEMMGDHRLMSKTVTYEESIKVPLLISVPGMRRSVRVTSPAAQVDIVPTLLELLGQARPSHLEGESWASSMRGEKQWGGRDVIIECNFRGYSPGGDRAWADQHVYYQRTVVTPERWKLSFSDVGEGELYDLNTDPRERRNLFYDARHKSKSADLRERIRRWQKSTGDSVDLGNVNAAWPDARRPSK